MSTTKVKVVESRLHLMQRPTELPLEIDSTLDQRPNHQQPRYVRWNPVAAVSKDSLSLLELQTAVTTWKNDDRTLHLHSQVHLGSKSYYETYATDPIFDSTPTLYELLVDEAMLQHESPDIARLQHRVRASSTDEALALQYGWECQANIIDYARMNWYHADWTRQEYAAKVAKPFALTSSEAATALFVGPPLSTTATSRRRIFTNLFLPGNYFALFLRAVLWMAVPSPELSILLLDWSSTWQNQDTNSSKGQISPIAQAVLQSMGYGQWLAVRQLIFGQVLIAGHKAAGSATNPETACIGGRNDRALQVVDAALETLRAREVNLLYGCNHCPDLHRKLQDKGFTCHGIEWKTVWSISPAKNAAENETSWKAPIVAGIAFYLGIDGADWIGTIQDIVSAKNVASSGIAALLYLVRHVGLYLGMSKFLLDMDELAASNASFIHVKEKG